MKKGFIIALVVVLALAMAGVAFAGVAGSRHDLGTGANLNANRAGTGSGQVCVFCHHPHKGTGGVTNALLWNINDAGGTTYNVYNGTATMNAVGAVLDNTIPQSYLCMSCHDGGMAASALVRAPRDGSNNTAWNFGGSASDIGTTLVDDHPINFTYDATLATADGGLQTPGAANVVGFINATSIYPLYSGKVQCSTCHAVHAGSYGVTPGDSKDAKIQFMRGNTAASMICRDCHTNK